MSRYALEIRRSAWALALGLTLACAGCSEKNKGPKLDLTPVAWTVTLDGKPLADANVGFYLQGSPQEGYHGSGAKTDVDGKYELTCGAALGGVPGSYKVTVSRLVGADGASLVFEEGMDAEQMKMAGQAKEALPAKYSDMEQTELTIPVERGKADGYDISLSSS